MWKGFFLLIVEDIKKLTSKSILSISLHFQNQVQSFITYGGKVLRHQIQAFVKFRLVVCSRAPTIARAQNCRGSSTMKYNSVQKRGTKVNKAGIFSEKCWVHFLTNASPLCAMKYKSFHTNSKLDRTRRRK